MGDEVGWMARESFDEKVREWRRRCGNGDCGEWEESQRRAGGKRE